MKTGILNLVIGLVFVGLGATGTVRFMLLGKLHPWLGTPKALMVAGGIIGVIGAWQIVRGLARRREGGEG